jgi:phage I-like protein
MNRTVSTAPSLTPIRDAVLLAAVADAGDAGGDWMLVMPAGSTTARDGRGPFRLSGIAAMEKAIAAARRRLGRIEMRVNYDHATTGPAAGWVEVLEARADGIWAKVNWTEKARAAIKAGEYRYLSPCFVPGKDGSVAELFDVALVNYPALDLEAVAASADNPNSEDTMDFMSRLRAALKLDAGASEEAILAAVSSAAKPEPQAMSAVALAAGLSATATADELVAAVTTLKSAATNVDGVNAADFAALKADAVAMAAELNALKTGQAKERATALVDGAIRAGCVGFNALNRDRKIALAAASPEGFAAVEADIVEAPKIANGAIVPASKPERGADGTVALSAEQKEVCAALSMSEADFASQLKLEQEKSA